MCAILRETGEVVSLTSTHRLAYISPIFKVPSNSLHMGLVINVVLGFVYLGSSQGFNALLGGTMGFAMLAYGLSQY